MNELNVYDPEVACIDGTGQKHVVYWSLGNFCLYDCSYCIPLLNSGNIPYPSIEVIQNALNKFPKCTVIFSGGEPTYHPEFERIVKEKPEHISISVLSNAARPFSFWERIVDYLDQAHLSYHIGQTKFDRFAKVAELLYTTHKKVGRISVVMLATKWDECVDVFNKLVSLNLPVTTKPILEYEGNSFLKLDANYSAEQLSWLSTASFPRTFHKWISILDKAGNVLYRTDPTELMSTGMNHYKGWMCHVPEYYTFIHPDGSMKNTCCPQGAPMGNIHTEFTITSTPILCKMNTCHTYPDLTGKKFPPIISV
jgi:organic radical activating enzyme